LLVRVAIQTWRQSLARKARSLRSVPWFLGGEWQCVGIRIALALLALRFERGALVGDLAWVAAALAFNAPFLAAAVSLRGPHFLAQSVTFLLADLLPRAWHALGICDFALRGRRY
jgi:hypothetical protein